MWNYFLESFRNKKNRPLSFFVNWIGMTLGLAAVIVIYLFIVQEVRHDKSVYAESMKNVYRTQPSGEWVIMPSATRKFVTNMPEVKSAVRVMAYDKIFSTEGLAVNKKLRMKFMVADSTLLEVLPFKLIAGTHKEAFAHPNNVIVSRSAAIKFFETEDVIGKTIKINNDIPVQISAIMEDIPENSTFSPEIIYTTPILTQEWKSDLSWMDNAWNHWNMALYIALNDNVDVTTFEAKYAQGVKDEMFKAFGEPSKYDFKLIQFNDIYLSGGSGFSHSKMIDKNDVMVMAFIALLILAIAIINYVNIYTARSTEVIRAMGIKSIMGARRLQLIVFVIFDSIVITIVSALSAFLLAGLLEPFYIDIIGSNVSFSLSWDMILVLFVGVPVVCGVISGIFPAIVLTRLKPLDAIANRSSGNKAMGYVRNGLIVLQFTIAIALIGSTLFINKQMQFISDMDLGYNRENIVCVNGSNFIGKKFSAFRNTLLENSNIEEVALMKSNPSNIGELQTVEWGDGQDEKYSPKIQWADQNALTLLGVKMVEGDSLLDANELQKGQDKFIINQTMANIIRAQIPGVTFPFKQFIGVFSDFQANSVTQPVQPLVLASVWKYNDSPYADAYVKINGKKLDETLDYIEESFNEIYSDQMYEFSFLDEHFAMLYKNENLFRSRLLTFSVLAIFISCLGLFALVSYSVQRRRKEIALRKVYGSTIDQIIGMLSVDFLKWLVISFVIAVPIIYYVASIWVAQFAYKTDLSWWVYGLSLIVALMVAMATVFGQAYDAATENPAKAIKSE